LGPVQHQAALAKKNHGSRWNFELEKVYFIGIMNFVMETGTPAYRSGWGLYSFHDRSFLYL